MVNSYPSIYNSMNQYISNTCIRYSRHVLHLSRRFWIISSIEIFIPYSIRTTNYLQDVILNFSNKKLTYFLWFTQIFLLALFLMISMPRLYLVSPRSFISNYVTNYDFKSEIILLPFSINNISSTYRTMIRM